MKKPAFVRRIAKILLKTPIVAAAFFLVATTLRAGDVYETTIESNDYRFDFNERRATVRVGGQTVEIDGFGVEFLENAAPDANETDGDNARSQTNDDQNGDKNVKTDDDQNGETNGDVVCVRTERLGAAPEDGMRGRFEIRFKNGRESKFFELTVDRAPNDGVDAGALRLRFRSDSTDAIAVSAGNVRTSRRWFRFSTERYAEAYAQPFWPRTAYFPEEKLFFFARWSLDGSAGSRWAEDGDNRFSGVGDFEATPRVLYLPNTAGARAAVDETLTIRVGTDLWETVGRPPQRPSEYFDELKNSVYLDFWSGTATEIESFLTKIAKLTNARFRFLTVFQNWEAGGWDALLPDSIRLPDFPPNPNVGTVEEIANLAKTAKKYGRFALRTNYMFLRKESPSYREGAAKYALDADGTPRWSLRLSDVDPILARQEREIAELFAPNANFSDQLTSGAAPWAYSDCAPDSPTSNRIGKILTKEREIAKKLKASQAGPLGSESLMDEHLLGEFVDYGDFGIYNGFHRSLTPEFKLRRLNRLTAFYGAGLAYRFYEFPPFKNYCSLNRDYVEKSELRDDYRAAEILYGNGAYLFYEMNYVNRDKKERIPWNYVATEIALVGTLQRRFVGEEVAAVEYWSDGAWRSLLEIVEQGVDPTPNPWGPQPAALRRVKVSYRNGLTVVVDRWDDDVDVELLAPELASVDFGGRSPIDFADETLVLPKSGWVAWAADGSVLAFSGRRVEKRKSAEKDVENKVKKGETPGPRVDFIDDSAAGVRYVDPRGREFEGRTAPTLWLDGKIVPGWDEIVWEAPEN